MITTQDIKHLRERTGAGILDCREALIESEGDLDRALRALRAKAALVTEKRADRTTHEGYLATYNHTGRIGVVVELQCETDFVSGNRGFRELAHEIALQVAAQKPRWISRDDVPAEVIAGLAAEERATAVEMGKSTPIVERIVAGKLERFYRDNCLLEQPYIRNDKETIGDLVRDKILAFGEKLSVSRFVRLELGE